MKAKPQNQFLLAALTMAGFTFAMPTAQAGTLYWDGTATTINTQSDNTITTAQNWINGGNWDNGTTSALKTTWTAGDSAVFGGTAASQTITASALTIGNMTFGQGGLGAGTSGTAYTISGAVTLTLSASTITTNTPTTISSILGGATTLTKAGAATLTLSTANTYTGTTSISAGTLKIGNATALGTTTTNTTVTSGATLDLNGQTTAEIFGAINGTGVGAAGALINSSATAASITGTITGGNFTVGGTGNITLATVTTGPVVAKIGTGTLTLGGTADNVSLTLNVTGGTAILGKTSSTTVHAVGTAATVGGTGTIQLGGSGDYQWYWQANMTVNSGGTLDLNGKNQNWNGSTGLLNLNGTGSGNGALINNTGTSTLTPGTGSIVLQSNSSIGGTGNIVVAGGTGANGAISGTFALTKAGTGRLTLSSANTYSGGTTLTAGTLQLGNAAALGTGALTIISGSLDSSVANLINANNNTQSWNGDFTFVGTQNLNLGTGAVTPNANRQVTVTANTLTVGGVIGGTFNLSKMGAGTLSLAGTNTYTGSTAIGAGTLAIASTGTLANTAISATGTGTLAVKPGTGTVNLGNTGTLGAGATLSLASGTAFSMVDGAIGTTNLVQEATYAGNALTLDTATLNFEMSGATADLLAVTGTNSTVSVTGTNTINLTALAALTVGTYNLITTANAAGGLATGGTFRFANGLTTALVGFGTNNYPLTLNNSANIQSVTIGAALGAMTWTGQTAGNGAADISWTTGTSTNWALGATAIGFANNTAVSFQDTNAVAGGVAPTGTVTIQAGGVSPSSTTFDNSSVPYTVSNASGNIGITGSGGLVIQGGGSVNLNSANTYTGNTTVNTGTLTLAGATGVGTAGGYLYNGLVSSATVTVASGAQIVISSNNTTVHNALGYGATATWVVSGTIDSTGGDAHTLPATVTLNNGTLTGVANATFGTFIANSLYPVAITANGISNTISSSNLGLATGGTLTLATPLATDALSVSSVLGVTGQLGGALTKTGLGTVTLSGTNIYTGATTVSAGTLTLTGPRTAAATGGFTVGNLASNTGTLNLSNGTFTAGTTGSNFLVGVGDNTVAGVINQSGGSLTTAGNQLLIGNGGTGTASGSNATGTYNLSAGTLNTIAGALGVVLGVNTGTTGNFNLSDTGLLNMAATSTLQITRSDNSAASNITGVFTQTGGTATVGILQMGGSNATPANNTNASATLNLSAGTFTATTFNVLSGANNSVSAINISGTADVTLPAFPTAHGSNSTATITFNGGTLRSAATSTAYMSGLTNAFIKAGGATFAIASGRNITITQNLLTDAASTGGGLTKADFGTLSLAGTNTYTGATTVSDGTLQLGNGTATGSLSTGSTISVGTDATFVVNQSDTVTQGTDFSNAAITGLGGFTQSGTGTTVLNVANGYTGATTVNAGTLNLALGSVATNILSPSSALTMGGGTLQLTGTGFQTLNGLTTTASTSSRIVLGAFETLTLGTLTSAGAGSSLNFNTVAGGANGATVGSSSVVLTGQTPGAAINSGFTVTDAGGFGLATVDGFNQVIRMTTGTLLPASGATSGIDYLIDNNAGGAAADGSSTLAITTSEAAKSVTVVTTAASGTLTLNSGIVLSNNNWNFGGAGSNIYQITNAGGAAGGTGLSSVAANDTISINNYNTGVVTFASPILANGVNNVIVLGTGTTVFSGTNTYTGTTVIAGGTLNANSTGALGDGSATNTLIFTGSTLQAGGTITSPSTRTVTLTGNGTIDTNNYAVSIAGVVNGAGGLTKSGAGTLTLTAANTFAGTVAVNTGTLALAPTGALTMANIVTGTGTLNINPAAANNLVLSGDLSGFTHV